MKNPNILVGHIVFILAALAVSVVLSGCANNTYYAGLGIHSTAHDAPEVTLHNPVFVGGGEWRTDDGELGVFVEHHSAVYTEEVGVGYNLAGVKVYLKSP